ncbi:MAG TPA: PaaI family thioesterase [Longimicrobium sp.]|nr:PaaI family thioesterase [Longimicrobium sp.]
MPRAPEPGFEARVRQSFTRQRLMETLGARLARVSAGEVDVELDVRDEVGQQHGFVHAGALASILDSAAGFAAYTLMPADAGVLSVEFKVNLLAPARGERIIARGRVVRAGRTISVVTADAFGIEGGRETHVATFTGTMMTIQGRPGVAG